MPSPREPGPGAAQVVAFQAGGDCNKVHPTVSSMMAEATSVVPIFRRRKFISRTTIATILTDATESAVPRKIEVIIRWSGRGSMARVKIDRGRIRKRTARQFLLQTRLQPRGELSLQA